MASPDYAKQFYEITTRSASGLATLKLCTSRNNGPINVALSVHGADYQHGAPTDALNTS
jgi:hypothetical protein